MQNNKYFGFRMYSCYLNILQLYLILKDLDMACSFMRIALLKPSCKGTIIFENISLQEYVKLKGMFAAVEFSVGWLVTNRCFV